MITARQIEIVKNLRHRTGPSGHSCSCEECTAIKQVCHYARIAAAQELSKKR